MSYETEKDTPRTDAVLENLSGSALSSACGILTDHARDLERQLNFIRAHCRVVYYPPGTPTPYPIEHTMAARKDQFDAILAEMPKT